MSEKWIPDRSRRKPVSITVNEDVLDRIDSEAARQRCSRSFLTEQLVLLGFDRVRELERSKARTRELAEAEKAGAIE